ncbi:MAG: ABC transporter ATP-binding protein, partial [Lawsonibacter sp.]|nr:ABC transporter ATP-binding protein [Lawsonibacter sp.]
MPGPNQAFKAGAVKPKNLKKTILRLVGYLTRSRLPLLFVLLCLLTSVATNLGGSYMVRPIANLLIDPNRTLQEKLSGLAVLIALLAGIYLLGCLATYGQSAAMVRLAERGVNRLRRDLFDSLQSLPLSYFDQHPHGELMSRFTNDADNVELALQQSVVSLLSSCLMFVGLVGLMLFINWKLFFVTAVVLVLTMTLFRKLGGRSRQFYQKQQKALGAVNGEIQEVIEGLKVVKAFTHEEEAKAKFRELNNAYRDSAQKANFYSTMIMPMAGNLMNISYALTAAFGGLLSVLQGFDLGGLATYLNYSRQVGQPLNQISQQMTTLLSAMAGAERIFEVMDTAAELDEGSVTLIPAEKDANGTLSPFTGQGRPRTWAWKTPRSNGMELVPVFVGEDETLIEIIDPEAVPDPAMLANHGWAWKYPGPNGVVGLHLIRGTVRNVPGEDFYLTELRGAVRFSHVDFSYVPGKRILKDVSVYADPGQKIAFVGSTGAGKTTITNLINRFYEIEGGMITYDGIRVKAIRKDDLRRSLGAVLQDTHLFTGTIMDNIRYGRLDATDEECIAAAKSANAHSFIRRLPEGYQTMVTGDGANLSQGQRQ